MMLYTEPWLGEALSDELCRISYESDQGRMTTSASILRAVTWTLAAMTSTSEVH